MLRHNNHTPIQIRMQLFKSLYSNIDESSSKQVWFGQCEIVLAVDNNITLKDLSSISASLRAQKKMPFFIDLSQLKQGQVQITFEVEHPKSSITSELLNHPEIISELFYKLKVSDANVLQDTIFKALQIINQNGKYFIEQYGQKFYLDENIRIINRHLKMKEMHAWLSLLNQDTITPLMKEVEEAGALLDKLIAYCKKKMESKDVSDKIAYHALETIFTKEKLELRQSLEKLQTLQDQFIDLKKILESHHYSACDIEKIVSFIANKEDREASNKSYQWVFAKICLEIANVKLLSSDVLMHIAKRFTEQTFTFASAYQLFKQIEKLKPLLNEKFLQIVINGTSGVHSCVSRLNNGGGLTELNDNVTQYRWALCSEYAIDESREQFALGLPLKERVDHSAKFRKRVAINEDVKYKNDFGSIRIIKKGDQFSDGESYSATSPSIFSDLVIIVQKSLCHTKRKETPENRLITLSELSEKTKLSFNFFSPHCAQSMDIFSGYTDQKISLTTKIGGISLPLRKINLSDKTITTDFSAISEEQSNAVLAAIDQLYILPLRAKSCSQDDTLLSIGYAAYYLCNLYRHDRGSASIALWEINGILKEQFDTTFGQISMGPNRNVSFDVYAHLTVDPNSYAVEFARVLMIMLNLTEECAKPFRITST